MRLIRVLAWYEKDPGSRQLGEAELTGVDLATLQEIFRVEASNPMYACWPVGLYHAKRLQPYTNVPINLAKYEYFVECYSES
jgi:hypothetical protein